MLCTKVWRSLTYILILLAPEGGDKDGEEKLSSGDANQPAFPAIMFGGIGGTFGVRQCLWCMLSFVNTSFTLIEDPSPH